jgi:WD40 repeat protein|tara:strand:- start:319 stop:576 length:258 start_codon:yes stop_codon:yes gene_type:complete
VIVLLENQSLCVYKSHRETALLEKILQQSELRDAEDKAVVAQQIVSMELVRTESKDDIPPFDREILNEKLHVARVGDVWGTEDGP